MEGNYPWTHCISVHLVGRGTLFVPDYFKYVYTVNSEEGQKCHPQEQRAGLLTVSHKKMSSPSRVKVRQAFCPLWKSGGGSSPVRDYTTHPEASPTLLRVYGAPGWEKQHGCQQLWLLPLSSLTSLTEKSCVFYQHP